MQRIGTVVRCGESRELLGDALVPQRSKFYIDLSLPNGTTMKLWVEESLFQQTLVALSTYKTVQLNVSENGPAVEGLELIPTPVEPEPTPEPPPENEQEETP